MKFVSFKTKSGEERAGFFSDGKIVDLQKNAQALSFNLPSTMREFLENWDKNLDLARKIEEKYKQWKVGFVYNESEVTLLAPVPHPSSCRDAYAFRQHVAAARKSRGLEMLPEFDQFPVFYYTNHLSIIGPGDVLVEKDHLEKLDFELESAIVIGKKGKNISCEKADFYIAGYMIMNDFSARLLQAEEMKMNLGPAKGKDFATSLGPWLVTPDELEEHKVKGKSGNRYDLEMKAFHNGQQVSNGNMKDMNWTFAEIIERCSYGVELLPGDVIGSGTVGTGCYLELNGTRAMQAKEKGQVYEPVWLQEGDTIELEITGLGRLKNKIVKAKNDYSILAKKKLAQVTV